MDRPGLPYLPALLVAGLLTGACASSRPDPVRPVHTGDSLAATSPGSRVTATLPPGQEVIEVDAGLHNISEVPLRITKLRPGETKGVPGSAEVVRVALLDPDSINVAGGLFVTFPPVMRRAGACVRSKVFPARGATLDPDAAPLLLVWVRAIAPGRVRVPAFNATYEQQGGLWQQTIRIDGAAALTVKDGAEPLTPSRDERACASRVQLLPGAVHI